MQLRLFNGSECVVRLLGVLFTLLGAAKLHGVILATDADSAFLDLQNPIVPLLANRSVMTVAALAEIVVGVCALSTRPVALRAGLLLWLAISTLAYKVALAAIKYRGPCGCLLGVNRFIPLKPSTQQWLAEWIVLAAVILSSAVLLYSVLELVHKRVRST
jgi:hypothetical protein